MVLSGRIRLHKQVIGRNPAATELHRHHDSGFMTNIEREGSQEMGKSDNAQAKNTIYSPATGRIKRVH